MATRVDVEDLAVGDLCELLSRRYQEEIGEATLEAIRSNRLNGRSLLELTEKELAELVPMLGDRKVVQRFINSYVLPPTDAQPQVKCDNLSGVTALLRTSFLEIVRFASVPIK